MLFVKQILISLIIIGSAVAIAKQIPMVHGFDWYMTIGGLRWFVVWTFLALLAVDGLFNGVRARPADRSALQAFAFEMAKLLCVPVGALLGWLVHPQGSAYMNPEGGVLFIAVVGVGMGLNQLAHRWIAPVPYAKG